MNMEGAGASAYTATGQFTRSEVGLNVHICRYRLTNSLEEHVSRLRPPVKGRSSDTIMLVDIDSRAVAINTGIR